MNTSEQTEEVEFGQEQPMLEPEVLRPTTWLTSQPPTDEYEPMTIEKMFFKILEKNPGGCGKFQWLVATAVMLGLIGFGYIEYCVSYLELIPVVNCEISPGVWKDDCTMDEICMGATTPQIEFEVDYDYKTSLHNWVEPLNLYCTPGFKLALLGSMYFAGWATTILVIPLMADKTGRKWWFTGCIAVTALTFVGFFLSKSLPLSIALMYIVGAANSGRVMVGFVLGQEFLTPFWAVVFGTAFHFLDNSTALITTAYFDFINNHYLYISLVGFGFTCLSLILMLVFAPESPLWQLKYGRIAEGQKTINRMMAMSGIDARAEVTALEFDIKELNR
jgi:hypothetical protein